ncbi:ATP-dependent protease La (LON) domain protein [Phycisphaerae bacterium RAS2]|nr:ATP-dependent protease La (LON) domain protein [Phycisphaerae bacterium RAS2]
MGEVTNGTGSGVDLGRWIPIFPLPSTVLLPRVVLPLHIFETRYRRMMKDALADQRALCVALLMPGYEAKYHTLEAAIQPVVGVGRILKSEKTDDGRYYFLLQGASRARLLDEDRSGPYRRGLLEPLVPRPLTCEDECALRQEIRTLLAAPPLAEIAQQSQWMSLFKCNDLTLSDVLDVLASSLLTCPDEKQAFLSEPCVLRRAGVIRDVLRLLSSELMVANARCTKPRSWPPKCCDN